MDIFTLNYMMNMDNKKLYQEAKKDKEEDVDDVKDSNAGIDLPPMKDEDESDSHSNEIDDMFNDIFKSTPASEEEANMNADDEADDMFSIDGEDPFEIDANDNYNPPSDTGDNISDTDMDIGDSGDDLVADAGGNNDNIFDIEDHREDSYADIDDDTTLSENGVDDKPVDNATEIKRKNLTMSKLRDLLNLYEQHIAKLRELQLPPDKEKLFEPIFKEYENKRDMLSKYITTISSKENSFLQIKAFMSYSALFSILDAQTQKITDIIFPDKKGRKKK